MISAAIIIIKGTQDGFELTVIHNKEVLRKTFDIIKDSLIEKQYLKRDSATINFRNQFYSVDTSKIIQ